MLIYYISGLKDPLFFQQKPTSVLTQGKTGQNTAVIVSTKVKFEGIKMAKVRINAVRLGGQKGEGVTAAGVKAEQLRRAGEGPAWPGGGGGVGEGEQGSPLCLMW